jgi:hypothetical protein
VELVPPDKKNSPLLLEGHETSVAASPPKTFGTITELRLAQSPYNALVNTALLVQKFLVAKNMAVITHPPY